MVVQISGEKKIYTQAKFFKLVYLQGASRGHLCDSTAFVLRVPVYSITLNAALFRTRFSMKLHQNLTFVVHVLGLK